MKAANFLAPNWPTNIPAKIQIETFVKLSRGRLGFAGTVPSRDVPTVWKPLERNAVICWAFPDNPLFRRVETRPNTLFDAIFVYLILVQVRESPLLHAGTVYERSLQYKGNAERLGNARDPTNYSKETVRRNSHSIYLGLEVIDRIWEMIKISLKCVRA